MTYFLPKHNTIHYTTLWNRLRIIEMITRPWTTGLRQMYRGLFSSNSKKFFCSPKCPDWLLFCGYWRDFHGGKSAWGAKQNTDLCLLRKLRMSGADTPCSTKNNPCALTWRKYIRCTRFFGFVWLSWETDVTSLSNSDWLVFIMEMQCVYCELEQSCICWVE